MNLNRRVLGAYEIIFNKTWQKDWNLKGKIQGSYDSELNDTGVIQAEELSMDLLELKYKFSKIYSSPQKRAVKTAEILGQAINVGYITTKSIAMRFDGIRRINGRYCEKRSTRRNWSNYCHSIFINAVIIKFL